MSGFDKLLDAGFDALVAGEPLAEIVASANGSGSELVELVALAGELRALATVTPRPEWKAATRQRLVAAARGELAIMPRRRAPANDSAPPARRVPRWTHGLAAAAVAVALGGTAWSVERAAASSLPGDALYPVKRSAEEVRFLLASSPEAKASLALDQAERRLIELNRLAGQGSLPPPTLVEDYRSALARALTVVESNSDQRALARRIEDRLSAQERRLSQLGEGASVEAAREVARAAQQRLSGERGTFGAPGRPTAEQPAAPIASAEQHPEPAPAASSSKSDPEKALPPDPQAPASPPISPTPPARPATRQNPNAPPTTGAPPAPPESGPPRSAPLPPGQRPPPVQPPEDRPSAPRAPERPSASPSDGGGGRPGLFPFPLPQVPPSGTGIGRSLEDRPLDARPPDRQPSDAPRAPNPSVPEPRGGLPSPGEPMAPGGNDPSPRPALPGSGSPADNPRREGPASPGGGNPSGRQR